MFSKANKNGIRVPGFGFRVREKTRQIFAALLVIPAKAGIHLGSSPDPGTRIPNPVLNTFITAVLLLCAITPANAASQLTDPTRPSWRSTPPRSAPAAQRFELASILIAEDRKIAIINGQAVGVGDIVDGAAVLVIDTNAVTVRRNGEELVLTLLPAGIKS